MESAVAKRGYVVKYKSLEPVLERLRWQGILCILPYLGESMAGN